MTESLGIPSGKFWYHAPTKRSYTVRGHHSIVAFDIPEMDALLRDKLGNRYDIIRNNISTDIKKDSYESHDEVCSILYEDGYIRGNFNLTLSLSFLLRYENACRELVETARSMLNNYPLHFDFDIVDAGSGKIKGHEIDMFLKGRSLKNYVFGMKQLVEDSGLYPTVTFQQLQAEFNKVGIDVYDLNDTRSHYGKWQSAKGYKRSNEVSVAQKQYAEYQKADDGNNASPSYFNFWHYLLDIYKRTGQTEIVIDSNLPIPKKMSEHDKQNVFKNVAMKLGMELEEVPDKVLRAISDELKTRDAVSDGVSKVIATVNSLFLGPIVVNIQEMLDN